MGLVERLHKGFQGGVDARLPAIRAWSGKHKFNLVRAAVLASSVALMLPGAWGHSVTVVEFAHLPAGLAAWQRHSLGIYRVCGPVSKFLYALPAYLAGVRVDYPASFDGDPVRRREWELGRLFQSQNVKRYYDTYRWSRLLPMLLTLVGGCLVCEWSTRLFGAVAGIFSLCSWCWLPPILAHGSLVTSDMPAAVLVLLSARTFWSFLLRPSTPAAFIAGAILGLAVATKLTLLVLCPAWIVLLLLRAVQVGADGERRCGSWLKNIQRLVALGLTAITAGVLVLDASYVFAGVGFTLSDWRLGRSSLAASVSKMQKTPGAGGSPESHCLSRSSYFAESTSNSRTRSDRSPRTCSAIRDSEAGGTGTRWLSC